MADEKKKATKKQGAEKAAAEKAPAKKRATKKDAAAKKAPAKKAAKKAAKKSASKKATAPTKAAAKEAPAKKEAKKPVGIKVRASSRYVRIAPRKARLVADQVRGLHIEKARALLQFSPRSAADDIRKLIESAASNAENNHDLIADEMRIAEITVDEGPTLRRYRPRARGSASPILKRTSHIAVALSPEQDGN
ncbi:MAG TPA: 50S ribosomal protein L22 [Solirubrobacterales bacterium]|nr:50S ribosomal protein L22 [Solirubrobacterales bacterium]